MKRFIFGVLIALAFYYVFRAALDHQGAHVDWVSWSGWLASAAYSASTLAYLWAFHVVDFRE